MVLAVLSIAFTSSAQKNYKLGHVNFSEIYSMMPGLDTVKQVYQEYSKSIQKQFEAMQSELESKVIDYQNNLSTMSSIIKQTKEKEIQDLQARLEAFQISAQEDLQNKEMELTNPIIERARKAIEDVAKENKFNYIFNTTEGLVLYADESEDITPLVKKKLGIE